MGPGGLFGFVGRVMSCGAGAYWGVVGCYFFSRLLRLKKAKYLQDIVDYDDPERETILKGTHRTKMADYIKRIVQSVAIIITAVQFNVMIGAFVISVVIPLVVEEFTLTNFLFWFGWYFL